VALRRLDRAPGAALSLQARATAGLLGAIGFLVAVATVPLLVPGYDPVRQTVSEIGEVGSPARFAFTVVLLMVAACLLVFGWAVRDFGRGLGRSGLAGYVAGSAAVSIAGVGVFAFPHPLHNWFGLSELIGYQAPLVLALSWRGAPGAAALTRFSALMAVVVWVAIVVNLIPLFRPAALWPIVHPVFGLVQRSLFAAWFAWAAGTGLLIRQRYGDGSHEQEARMQPLRNAGPERQDSGADGRPFD
jgi:hypothetical membrane protein